MLKEKVKSLEDNKKEDKCLHCGSTDVFDAIAFTGPFPIGNRETFALCNECSRWWVINR